MSFVVIDEHDIQKYTNEEIIKIEETAYKKGRTDMIDECIEEINKTFKDGYGFGVTVYPHTICNMLEQLKEKKDE